MNRYYFDHSATTRVDPAVADIMRQVMCENYGNPSSVHGFGRDAREFLDRSRETIAEILNADPAEVYFTSGGTEADNLALSGVMEANQERGRHLITSTTEHHAVLYTAEYLGKNGYEVSYIRPDKYGLIQVDDVARAIRPDTAMISIMHANNEVGTINPIAEIGRLARDNGIIFHTDAVQTFGKLPLNVSELNVDLLSLSGHKIYGPKGIGALYVSTGIAVTPRSYGGHHERELRPGTENLSGIAGLAKAASLCHESLEKENDRLKIMRDSLWRELQTRLPDLTLNGHPEQRLSGLLNVTFHGVEGEAILLALDMKGIAVSTGSACSSGQTTPSHVLLSMGLAPEDAQSSIRFSLGHENSDESIEYLLDVLPPMVEKFRAMSF
ncbi:cysteine desulfurase [bacterium]|nr:cysteine desulfurase [bacterium]MBU1651080.1 cysteine desulfurase [bacterium]MBU1881698.1 cysteine desulfurase [bacterium]